jgi:hypothetical protein
LHYSRIPSVFIIILTDGSFDFLLLISYSIKSAKEYQNFFSAGGAIDGAIGVGLYIARDALA